MSIHIPQLNIDEALRYMGCPPEQAGEALRKQAASCAQEILAVVRPRWSWRRGTPSAKHPGGWASPPRRSAVSSSPPVPPR